MVVEVIGDDVVVDWLVVAVLNYCDCSGRLAVAKAAIMLLMVAVRIW
jgi:cellobiose phosphorylase